MKKINEIDFLSEISELLKHEHKSIQAFIKQVLCKIYKLIRADLGFIGLVEETEEERWIVIKYLPENANEPEAEKLKSYTKYLKIGGKELPEDERSIAGYVAYTKKALQCDNVKKERFYKASNANIRSELCVPIILDEEVLGVLNLESQATAFFTAEYEQILKIVARMIAYTLDDLMSRDGFRKPVISTFDLIKEKLDMVSPVVTFDASEVLNDLAEIIADSLRSQSCTIWLLNESDKELTLRGAFGPHRQYVNLHREKKGENVAWKVINQRCSLKYGSNYYRSKESGRFDFEVYGQMMTTPFIAAPLLVHGEPIGVIKVGLRKAIDNDAAINYTDANEQFLNVVAGQIAMAVELKKLEIERREQTLRRVAMLSTLDGLFTELDLKKVLQKAVNKIPELCHGLHCSIFLYNQSKGKFVLAASKGLAAELIGKASYKPGEGLTGWVGKHGKPLLMDSRTPDDLSAIHPQLQWKSKHNEGGLSKNSYVRRPFVAVPIFLDKKSVGVIRVSDRKEGFFAEADEHMIALIASHISAAISYSKRYEVQLKLLQNIKKILMVLTKGFQGENIDIDNFGNTILEEAAKSGAELLNTDVLTLYKYDPAQDGFDFPPIRKGHIKFPKFMNSALYPGDIPNQILLSGSQYWENVQDAKNKMLIGDIPARDGLPPRQRFVEREGIVSSVGIRLEVHKRVVGVLFLNFRKYQLFNAEKKELIETFANQIALSLEIARLYRTVKSSASREEADYLAQELHDAVLQILSSEVVHRVGLIRDRLVMGDLHQVEKGLKILEKTSKFCAEECRDIMRLLKTHVVDDFGLEEALYRYRDELLKPTGLLLHIHVEGNGGLPINIERQLYRIAQAALGNVVAHSEATKATLSLDSQPDHIKLCIEDDGKGFDTDLTQKMDGKYGLRGIEKRVQHLNGRLDILSKPGEGTKIVITIPNRPTDIEKASSVIKAYQEKKSHNKIKVYVVDDEEAIISGIQQIIELTPEKDLEYVGSFTRNTPDLPDRIMKSQADVILLDIVLGSGIRPEDVAKYPESDGRSAIRNIRAKIKKDIRILVFSAWPQFCDEVVSDGADGFIQKESTTQEIREAIRDINNRMFVKRENYFLQGISGLNLYLEKREIIVVGHRKKTPMIHLTPNEFAFLYYLAKERVSDSDGWVKRNDSQYRFERKHEWRQVAKQVNGTYEGVFEINTDTVSKWAHHINKKTQEYFAAGAQSLIDVPKAGPKAGPSYYVLNPQLSSSQIEIDST